MIAIGTDMEFAIVPRAMTENIGIKETNNIVAVGNYLLPVHVGIEDDDVECIKGLLCVCGTKSIWSYLAVT